MQRLDAAAGAQVEGPADGPADRHLGQGGRGGAGAQDEVRPGRGDVAVQAGHVVGDDPAVHRRPGGLIGTVRPDVHGGRHSAGGLLEQPVRVQGLEQAGKGPLRCLAGHGALQDEQPQQGGLRVVLTAEGAQGGQGGVAAQRCPSLGTESGIHGIDGELGGSQRLCETAGIDGARGVHGHMSIVARPPDRVDAMADQRESGALRVAVLDHTAELGGAELALVRLLDNLDPQILTHTISFQRRAARRTADRRRSSGGDTAPRSPPGECGPPNDGRFPRHRVDQHLPGATVRHPAGPAAAPTSPLTSSTPPRSRRTCWASRPPG